MNDTAARFSDLADLGWDQFFEAQINDLDHDLQREGLTLARVIGDKRVLIGRGIELIANIAGRLRYDAESSLELPAVGDWVLVSARVPEGRATIEAVLERKSRLARRAAGDRDEAQVIAANVDTAFIVTSMNQDLSERRLERYLSVVRSGGATPVILLSKADLAEPPPGTDALARAVAGGAEYDHARGPGLDQDREATLRAIEEIAGGAPVIAVSSRTGEGFEALTPYLAKGQTIVVIGSSGVGKSTLINRLLGQEALKTQESRDDDDKGRHTTTARYLLPLPQGAMIIDTPGMREVQLWDADEGVGETFDDIAEIALRCKFTNCRHENEKGCAVRAALASGEIDSKRLESYKKLLGELAHEARKYDKVEAAKAKDESKKFSRTLRERLKDKGRK